MEEIKLFLSSKIYPEFEGLDGEFTLGDLRNYLKHELQNQTFLDEKAIKILMNEEGFEQDFTKDAFNTCIEQVKKADIIVILYNADAGWAPANTSDVNGICHEEFMIAVQDHPSMTYGISLKKYFASQEFEGEQDKRNRKFQDDVDSFNRFTEYSEGTTIEAVKKYVLNLIKGYIIDSIGKAFKAKREIDASNTIFGKTLDWTKLNYKQRTSELVSIGNDGYKDVLTDVIKVWHAVPDNMSVAEARNRVGRPFLHEHEELAKSSLKKGVIHFVAVYGNATELQVKNLIGYPDITVVKTSFGFYLWEQTSHIQIFFLTKCVNPNTLGTKKQQITNWLNSSKELDKVIKRAEARHHILEAINKSAFIANR